MFFSLAEHAASHLGHSYIGTEHILLGLCDLGTDYLFGVKVERIREEVNKLLGVTKMSDDLKIRIKVLVDFAINREDIDMDRAVLEGIRSILADDKDEEEGFHGCNR